MSMAIYKHRITRINAEVAHREHSKGDEYSVVTLTLHGLQYEDGVIISIFDLPADMADMYVKAINAANSEHDEKVAARTAALRRPDPVEELPEIVG